MAFPLFTRTLLSKDNQEEKKTSRSLLIEITTLTVIILFMVALLTALLAYTHQQTLEANQRAMSVTFAENYATQFYNNPTDTQWDGFTRSENNLVLELVKSTTKTKAGTLYKAFITITHDGDTLYELPVMRYLPLREVS